MTLKIGLENGALMQKTNELVEERKELLKKITQMQSKEDSLNEQIEALKYRQGELLQIIEQLQSSNQVAYILDKEKLTELKNFTLEAIQARRWKSSDFVNGAYDAIGLFYRTLLSDRPIQKKLK